MPLLIWQRNIAGKTFTYRIYCPDDSGQDLQTLKVLAMSIL